MGDRLDRAARWRCVSCCWNSRCRCFACIAEAGPGRAGTLSGDTRKEAAAGSSSTSQVSRVGGAAAQQV